MDERTVSRRNLFGIGLGRLLPDLPEERPRRATVPEDVWGAADYGPLALALEPAAAELADFCAPAAGTRLLDVGAGDGNLAMLCADRGADVVALDRSAGMVARGRDRVPGAEWHISDLRDMPFEDDAFDCTASAFGAIYADPVPAVARELFRVTRPGGLVAMANWSSIGLVAETMSALWHAGAYPGLGARPSTWGRFETVYREFMPYSSEYDVLDRELTLATGTVEGYWDLLAGSYGPLAAALRRMAPNAATALRSEVVRIARAHRVAGGVSADYVIAYGRAA